MLENATRRANDMQVLVTGTGVRTIVAMAARRRHSHAYLKVVPPDAHLDLSVAGATGKSDFPALHPLHDARCIDGAASGRPLSLSGERSADGERYSRSWRKRRRRGRCRTATQGRR